MTLLVSLTVMGLALNFFRFPRRSNSEATNRRLIVAPADGKVVVMEEVEEPELLGRRCLKLSIFMSLYNVHANWVACNGDVYKRQLQVGVKEVLRLGSSRPEYHLWNEGKGDWQEVNNPLYRQGDMSQLQSLTSALSLIHICVTSASFMSFILYLKDHHETWSEQVQEYEAKKIEAWSEAINLSKERGEIRPDTDTTLSLIHI